MIRIDVSHAANYNPGNGPIGWRGFHATFGGMMQPDEVLGCPLGRGATVEGAVSDLMARTRAESGVSWSRSELEVNVLACFRCGSQSAHTTECETAQKEGK